MTNTLPVLFVTHGSPMLAIEPGLSGSILHRMGNDLPKNAISSILVISAHWLTHHKIMITASHQPRTMHDFSGFPDDLYQKHYRAMGSPEIATQIKDVLGVQQLTAELDINRGLDHGVWIPLQYMFPDASIPVIQLSMPWPLNATTAVELGEALKPLREMGILIIASGSMTHNLHDVTTDESINMSYIVPFTKWVNNVVHDHDLDSIKRYRELAPGAKNAHPTEEHFLPLIIALAASDYHDKVTEMHAGISYGAIAMNNYILG